MMWMVRYLKMTILLMLIPDEKKREVCEQQFPRLSHPNKSVRQEAAAILAWVPYRIMKEVDVDLPDKLREILNNR